MKILIVTGIFPPDIGGPATYVPEIAKALQDRGHQATVVTTSEPEHLDYDDSQHPFPVYRMNRRASLVLRSFEFIKVIFHHAKKTDAVLVNGLFLEATVASRLAGKPMVHKVVGDPAWERARNRGWTTDSFETFQGKHYGLKIEAFKNLRSSLVRQAEKIIVPSRYLASWVPKWGIPQNKILVIYNSGQSLPPVKPAPIPLNSPVKLATACRLVSWKGVSSIIKAIERMDDVGLLICGDGPEGNNLHKLVRDLGLSERIYFTGRRNRRDTLALIAGCDIFVLNSAYEGLPHVLLEAMSLGLPVIGTSVGGIPELVRNDTTGILIKAGDTEGLRLAILRLIAAPQVLKKMRENAKLNAKTFSVTRMVEETERVLQTVSGRSVR